MDAHIFDSFFLIFCGAAILASIALYTHQPILVAYIALGAIAGPFGFAWVSEVKTIEDISHIGIIFLLFLLGLDMQPKALFAVLKKVTFVGIVSSMTFAILGTGFGLLIGLSTIESAILGMATMFSSTIIGIKLLPTTALHHKHSGELMVGLLLFQDFIAILCLLILLSAQNTENAPLQFLKAIVALPILAGAAYVFVKMVLLKLITRFDRFQEYIFLLAIGWCLGLAYLAKASNLSAEIGAFIAGITLATSPISQFIAINLKPLRDFFLILFFFALGAQLNLPLLPSVAWQVTIFTALVLTIKPLTFYLLLKKQSEKAKLAWDIGFRLGQTSEFSILIVFVALSANLLSDKAALLIQSTAIATFVISSYIVIFNFPNPIAISEKLRRD